MLHTLESVHLSVKPPSSSSLTSLTIHLLGMTCPVTLPVPPVLQCVDHATMLQAAGPRIPAENLQLLSMLGRQDPRMLAQFGIAPEVSSGWHCTIC